MTHDDKLVRDVATDIEAVLRDLKFRATGQDPKNTGYEYAEVPAWRLRQWCAAIAVVKASASPTPEFAAIEARAKKALDMVGALCQPRGTEGSRAWSMSIPARPDYDPDIVIADALHDIPPLLAAVTKAEAENARLRKALEEMLDANAELAEFVGLSDMSGDNFANACAQMGRAVDAARAALSAPDAGASKDEGK